ncbi:MAG: hypothetical protein K2P93_05115 [Alphaproteobacteria bacterium]|nr:hypothetical protein [Alphaproteobacteria bacterium]
MNVKNITTNKSEKFSLSSLKSEDKILIGIGFLFLIIILGFIYLANTFFASLNQPVPLTTMSQREKTVKELDDDFKRIFQEVGEGFKRIDEAFEENRRRKDAAFQQAVENFQNGFEKKQEKFDKRPSPAQKMKFSK